MCFKLKGYYFRIRIYCKRYPLKNRAKNDAVDIIFLQLLLKIY